MWEGTAVPESQTGKEGVLGTPNHKSSSLGRDALLPPSTQPKVRALFGIHRSAFAGALCLLWAAGWQDLPVASPAQRPWRSGGTSKPKPSLLQLHEEKGPQRVHKMFHLFVDL